MMRGKKEERLSLMKSGMASTFQSTKRWRKLSFVYPYNIIIKNFVYIQAHKKKMEEFSCNFLLSHPKSTQACSSCLSYASCKKEEGFFLTEGGVGRGSRKWLFRINYIKSCCCGKWKLFFPPKQLLSYLNSNNIFSTSNSLFASLLFLVLFHMHQI